MNFHITNLHNIAGAAAMAQDGVAQAAKSLGFKELGIYRQKFYEDYWNSISHQIDGVIAPLYYGDVVIFQYPGWNGPDYDKVFVNKIKMYSGTKLIIFIHDIQKLLFNSEERILKSEINILNNADLCIFPSEKLHDYLIRNGLNESMDCLYQKVWEMPGYPQFTQHSNLKRMVFTGNIERFLFLKDYCGTVPIEYFDGNKPERENDVSFLWKGYRTPMELMKETSLGGFGLVWCDKENFDNYYSMNQPHKLGFHLSSGIPVVIREDSVHSDWIRGKGLGYVVESLDEADKLIQNTSDHAYAEMVSNVAKVQTLLLNGIYTKKLLTDAVIKVMEQ